ncbi:hypothetical protein DKX38_019823 [Salix brachista]|uniref:Uncharacterized protein n=1 Tax=Salix brachista TaxID=2182728 RepID=A0A5N5KH79_9ROSI|nr:hypothetical protein DKX38_019823 [Salix brachista]
MNFIVNFLRIFPNLILCQLFYLSRVLFSPVQRDHSGTVAEPKASSLAEPLLLNASYQISCEKQPSFRERSENGDLVEKVTLQQWNVLDIVGGKSHVLFNPLRTADLAREFAPESSVHMNTIPS